MAIYPFNRYGLRNFDWPDEAVALLRKRWAEGRSGTEIAKEIGHGLTRNAVIGKANRLGLPAHLSARVTYRGKRATIRVRHSTNDLAYDPLRDPRPNFSEKR